MMRRRTTACQLLLLAWLGWSASAQAQEPAKQNLESKDLPRPSILGRPVESIPAPEPKLTVPATPDFLLQTKVDPPLGFTGPSGVLPSEEQDSDHFVPMEDRWRSGFPSWDRYGNGNPLGQDTPYQAGAWWNPYRQNVLG